MDSGIRDVSDRTLQRDLTVVAALRQTGATVGPTPAERDRMRQRVLAEFSSVVHEGNSPVLPLRASRHRRWLPEETRGRAVVAAAAALCVVMSLSGMSVLLSRDAVPGDALYTFKRTAESAELGLTFGDQPKALKHLEFAGDRVNEIEIMAEQADSAGKWSAGQGKFVRALDDFDSDTTAGARLLTGLALHGQPSSLLALHTWAEQQKARLAVVRATLPMPIGARLDSTLALLDRVVVRASALSSRSSCVTITSGVRDELGLLPAKEACKPVPVDGTSAAVPLPGMPALPAVTPPGAIVPPNLLLRPPSVNPVPIPGQNGPSSRSGLPTTRNTGDVLPNPARPGSERLRPEPWRPFPANDSPKPAAPLPPWILQPRLLPPG
ncbi:MAG: hypothetical protein DLM62_20645 [Pseudonocardiales bacterium]|nr:MAG: hypothetical protein DLM62_20645 [Pseudonocardiales bacterium]